MKTFAALISTLLLLYSAPIYGSVTFTTSSPSLTIGPQSCQYDQSSKENIDSLYQQTNAVIINHSEQVASSGYLVGDSSIDSKAKESNSNYITKKKEIQSTFETNMEALKASFNSLKESENFLDSSGIHAQQYAADSRALIITMIEDLIDLNKEYYDQYEEIISLAQNKKISEAIIDQLLIYKKQYINNLIYLYAQYYKYYTMVKQCHLKLKSDIIAKTTTQSELITLTELSDFAELTAALSEKLDGFAFNTSSSSLNGETNTEISEESNDDSNDTQESSDENSSADQEIEDALINDESEETTQEDNKSGLSEYQILQYSKIKSGDKEYTTDENDGLFEILSKAYSRMAYEKLLGDE